MNQQQKEKNNAQVNENKQANEFVYNPASRNADEFINHAEILDSLAWAQEHKNNVSLCKQILEKAQKSLLKPSKDHCSVITHREAALLLACDDPSVDAAIKDLAYRIKLAFYGNRIVLFAPLYLSNYCINGCLYCPYHAKNRQIPRKKLTQEEIRSEVIALQDMGHKRLAIEAGEDPQHNPLEYILESIQTIYSIKHKNGSIRRVNVNVAATTVEEYKQLKDAQIGTYILFQETYNKEKYLQLHPSGPKHDYNWHTEAHDRAMQAGIDDVGLGVLFGLDSYAYELVGLIMHAKHLEACFGVGPHTISVPRVKPAMDIDPNVFNNGVPDKLFEKIIAIIRLAVPYTGMIISTREGESVREEALRYGISQISSGSRTSVGGYTQAVRPHDTEQFDVSDQRTLEEVILWLIDCKHIPSFCTACYRAGRTGDRFMEFCKNGEILNYCHPNALLTLDEYLTDYAGTELQQKGRKLIASELNKIPDANIRAMCQKHISCIENSNKRDFRF